MPKDNTRDKKNRQPGRSPPLRILSSLPVWILLLLVILAALVVWRRDALTSWANQTANSIWVVLGWGLVLIVLALFIISVVILRQQISEFLYRFRHWNRWLSGAAFFAAIWGIIALFGMDSGSVGQSIIGSANFVGALRVTGLIVLGIVLAAPRASFRATVKLISTVVGLFKTAPRPQATREKQEPAPRPPRPVADDGIQAPPALTPPEGKKPSKAEKPPPAPTPTPVQELKQIAQEVWKKYGEAPGLISREGWRLPPIDILDRSPEVELAETDNQRRAKLIEDALASYGVDSKVVQINAGPTVTQFGVEPGWDRKMKDVKEKDKDGNVTVRQEEVSKTRVKVERITSLANDLALALAATAVRIEAPVPGKSMVGIEVPNTTSSVVSLRGVIETNAFQKTQVKGNLAIALGKGAGGEAVTADLTKMPHILIAGATGSGKTVCLNTIICCLLMHNTPHDVKFIMIDPKRVELTPFNSIPHLATPVIVDTSKAQGTLRWLNQEMDKRYLVLAKAGARNIDGYNRNKRGNEKLPYLVLIIDELADLMMTGFDEVEHILCRLAQLARATGIHLVVATQRPSVDVVTGLIKANFPTRLSFAVTSQVDSRTILDMVGAEKLLGRGDMLFMPTEAAKPKRLQGCYVSDPETERLVYFWGNQRQETASLNIAELTGPAAAPAETAAPEDPLLESARQLLQEHKHISTSFLQRKLRIGYPRAARLMELLEQTDQGEEETEKPETPE